MCWWVGSHFHILNFKGLRDFSIFNARFFMNKSLEDYFCYLKIYCIYFHLFQFIEQWNDYLSFLTFHLSKNYYFSSKENIFFYLSSILIFSFIHFQFSFCKAYIVLSIFNLFITRVIWFNPFYFPNIGAIYFYLFLIYLLWVLFLYFLLPIAMVI